MILSFVAATTASVVAGVMLHYATKHGYLDGPALLLAAKRLFGVRSNARLVAIQKELSKTIASFNGRPRITDRELRAIHKRLADVVARILEEDSLTTVERFRLNAFVQLFNDASVSLQRLDLAGLAAMRNRIDQLASKRSLARRIDVDALLRPVLRNVRQDDLRCGLPRPGSISNLRKRAPAIRVALPVPFVVENLVFRHLAGAKQLPIRISTPTMHSYGLINHLGSLPPHERPELCVLNDAAAMRIMLEGWCIDYEPVWLMSNFPLSLLRARARKGSSAGAIARGNLARFEAEHASPQMFSEHLEHRGIIHATTSHELIGSEDCLSLLGEGDPRTRVIAWSPQVGLLRTLVSAVREALPSDCGYSSQLLLYAKSGFGREAQGLHLQDLLAAVQLGMMELRSHPEHLAEALVDALSEDHYLDQIAVCVGLERARSFECS